MRNRLGLVLIAFATGGGASAERLINVPLGRKIPFRNLRFEVMAERAGRGATEVYLGYGIGTQWEVEYRTQSLRDVSTRATVDISYNYTPPFTGVIPGISFGVLDVPNTTRDGRRYYASVTFRDLAELNGGDQPYELTLGVTFGTRVLPLLGASLPLDGRQRLLFEYDGFRPAAGYEFRPVPDLGLRFIIREDQTMLSITARRRF